MKDWVNHRSRPLTDYAHFFIRENPISFLIAKDVDAECGPEVFEVNGPLFLLFQPFRFKLVALPCSQGADVNHARLALFTPLLDDVLLNAARL